MEEKYVIVPTDSDDPNDAINEKKYSIHFEQGKEEFENDLEAAGADSHKALLVPGTGGSLTALPIVETQQGDVSAYIPTNVISITDGQIYLIPDLFYAGQRPSIDVGISVSRVGGDAQVQAMRKVAGSLKLDLAQYRELESFTQFGADLDEATRKQLAHGERLYEILKQDQHSPIPLEEQVVLLFAGTEGYLDDLPMEQVETFGPAFLEYMEARHGEILEEIREKQEISDDLRDRLEEVVTHFLETFREEPAAETEAEAETATAGDVE